MNRLRVLLVVAVALAGCGSVVSGGPGSDAVATERAQTADAAGEAAKLRLKLTTVATGLAAPVHLAAAPGEGNRLYVVEQPGRIRVIENGRLLSTPFLDIRSIVSYGGEQGLLSVAFHPGYATNRLLYVDYTDRHGDTRVVEYRTGASGQPAKSRELLFVGQPYPNHNGGQLAFGPDGLLYVGMGDGGAGRDPENRAQNLASRLGKLLRLDVDAPGASWEMVAYGLRNPWRFSFDRSTGDLWIGDVGQDEWEEIDLTPRSSPGLENYGWDAYEGNHRFEDKSPSGSGELVFPVLEYSHAKGCSVTGGFVYRGSRIPAARGRYFYGDYCSGSVWSLVVRGGKAADVRRHSFQVDELSSFGEGPTGELYLVSLGGTVYRLDAR